MSSPLSPTIAGIVMQNLKRGVLDTFEFDISFYYKYVNNIVMVVPTSKILFLRSLILSKITIYN